MNIISTGIASKKRVLLSRQHCDVKKADLEKYLTSFTRLMEKQSGDHTFVETDTNRFLYQPVDDYYVFVMTSLDSNIVGDISVVKTLAEIVQDVIQSELNEETIRDNLFELIFHMDEIISNNKREDLTLDQIKEYILMDSQEEKVHNMIQTSKEKEEKERRKQIAAKLEKRKELDHSFIDHTADLAPYVMRSVGEQRQTVPSVDVSQMAPGMKLTIQRANNELSSLGLNVTRNVNIQKLNKDEESINILDAEAPAVVQIVETCNGNVHLEGEIDVLNLQGELLMTVFEENARMASVEISGNPEIKMRYHPNLNKQMAAKNLIEPQSAQQPHKIGQSTSLVKWRHKSSEEQYFPIALSCWPNTSGGKTTVTVEMQNTSEKVLEAVNFQVLDSRYNQLHVDETELGTVQRNADSINWIIEKFEPQQSGKFEFTTNGNLNSILPFTLAARIPESITQFKVSMRRDALHYSSGCALLRQKHRRRHRTRGEGTHVILHNHWKRGDLMNNNYIVLIYLVYVHIVSCLHLPACYVKRAPVPRADIKVKWQRNEDTGKTKKAYYYVCDEGEVRIPDNARKRAFTYNKLTAALAKDDYCPPEQILARLNDIKQDQNFEEVKSIYLDIYRWFAFRKKEFLVHELFHKIRNLVKTKHFFFGRVYSRSLRRLFKFANCYTDQKDLSLVNYYVTWKDGMLDVSEQHLRFAINGRFAGVPEPSLLHRILALTKVNDAVKVINAIFKGVKYTKYEIHLDTRLSHLKVLNSTAALCLYRWLKGAARVHTVVQIHNVTCVQFKDVDALAAIKKKIMEDSDEYGMRMVRSVSNAFEHIYKLMQRIEEIPERTNTMNELDIGFENREFSRDELFSINLLAKLKLFATHRDLEQLVRGLFEIVQFLTEKVDEYSNDSDRTDFIRYFKQSVCVPYLHAVMTAMAYDHKALVRMKAIYDEMRTTHSNESYSLFLSKNALKRFMWYGMSKFCDLFNYKEKFQAEAEDVIAILAKDDHKYLYRNSDRQIVASTDALTMDLWNLNNGHDLIGPLKCQLVIVLDSIKIEQKVSDMIQKAKKDVLDNVRAPLEFDRVVNFYFKRYAGVNPIHEFHPELLRSGEPGRLLVHPIHKFMYIAVDE